MGTGRCRDPSVPPFGVGGARPLPGSRNGDDSDGARKVPPARVGAPSKGIPPPGLLAPPGAYSAAGGRPRAAAVRSPPPPRRAPLRHAGVSPPPPSGASPRRKHAASTRDPDGGEDEGGMGRGERFVPQSLRSTEPGGETPSHAPTRALPGVADPEGGPAAPPVSAEEAGRGRGRGPVTMAPAGAIFTLPRLYLVWPDRNRGAKNSAARPPAPRYRRRRSMGCGPAPSRARGQRLNLATPLASMTRPPCVSAPRPAPWSGARRVLCVDWPRRREDGVPP